MASNYNLFFAKGGPFAKMKNEKEQFCPTPAQRANKIEKRRHDLWPVTITFFSLREVPLQK